MAIRERVFHGQKRSAGVNAIGTLSANGTVSQDIDLAKGDIHSLTTKTGALSTLTLNLKNVYKGAKVMVLVTSTVASDALGTVEIEGTDVSTDLIVGSFDDEAVNLIEITVLDPAPASGSIVMSIRTVA